MAKTRKTANRGKNSAILAKWLMSALMIRDYHNSSLFIGPRWAGAASSSAAEQDRVVRSAAVTKFIVVFHLLNS